MTYRFLPEWPAYSNDPSDILKLDPTLPQSIDLEWTAQEVPDVLGISDGKLHVTVPYDEGIEYFLHFLKLHPDIKIAGHNFVGADLPMLVKRDIPVRLEQVEDSILYHYLVNMHLCKASGKSALDEENGTEIRGRGFL